MRFLSSNISRVYVSNTKIYFFNYFPVWSVTEKYVVEIKYFVLLVLLHSKGGLEKLI